MHLFFECNRNSEAAEALIRCSKSYDTTLTAEKALRLELEADKAFLFPSLTLLVTGLEFIWENRKQKKYTMKFHMRAELEAAVSLRRRSSSRSIRESANIMHNMIVNFFC